MAFRTRPVIERRLQYLGIAARLLLLGLALSGSISVLAQDRRPESDTLRSYDLEEIVVTSGAETSPSSSTLQRVSNASIARHDAPAIDVAARLIPAAHIQTNSRGETLIYLRTTGERQVAAIFDGALLNISSVCPRPGGSFRRDSVFCFKARAERRPLDAGSGRMRRLLMADGLEPDGGSLHPASPRTRVSSEPTSRETNRFSDIAQGLRRHPTHSW